jgi:hypothetical protein
VFDDDEGWNVPVPGKLYGELINSNEEQVGESKTSMLEKVDEVHKVD